MKNMTTLLLITGLLSIAALGCTERKATKKQQTTTSTPGGTTTVTIEQEVTKTGKNPPNSTP